MIVVISSVIFTSGCNFGGVQGSINGQPFSIPGMAMPGQMPYPGQNPGQYPGQIPFSPTDTTLAGNIPGDFQPQAPAGTVPVPGDLVPTSAVSTSQPIVDPSTGLVATTASAQPTALPQSVSTMALPTALTADLAPSILATGQPGTV